MEDAIKQVDKSHYRFRAYVSKARWSSFWHQLDEVIRLEPDSVLEIGPGPGIFKRMAAIFDLNVETVDIDPELNPDHVCSAGKLYFDDRSYDLVCAFQMLEHMPYDQSMAAFSEMVRVGRRNVLISLPDAKPVWPYQFYIPKFGHLTLHVPRPTLQLRTHHFNGEHYWEVNKRGYSLKSVIKDYSKFMKLVKTFRVAENPYHRFFLFQR